MKRLLTILLLSLSLVIQAQTVHYYPSYTDSYAKVPGQEVAILVRLPAGYTPEKKWPWKIFVHGMGQRGPGTVSALKTVWGGAMQAIPEDWKTSCDQNGIIGVLVNYNTFFQPASWVWTINFIKGKYSVVDKPMGQGFSWGGGSLQKFYCSSDANAGMLAVAVPIAPTIEYNAGWENVGKASLPVCLMVNKGDSTTKAITAYRSAGYINASNPSVPATYLEFPINGHGGTKEGLSNTPPSGLAETIDKWYLDVLQNGPRPPKKSAGIPTNPTPPDSLPALRAVASFTGLGPLYGLDGRQSTGYKWARWTVIKAPDGVKLSTPMIQGAGNITAKFTAPQLGQYEIQLEVNDDRTWSSPSKVVINYGAAPVLKTFAGFDSVTGLITWSDGSTEPGTVRYSVGTWTVKNGAGQVITF